MKITINGKDYTPENKNLNLVLDELGHAKKTIAVAVNEKIIPQKEREKYLLQDGDRLIIVSPRQGG